MRTVRYRSAGLHGRPCLPVNKPGIQASMSMIIKVWKWLADHGTELVIWPSAYSAGTSLQAHALNHHYYIATATQKADCVVYDITGKEILYESSDDLNVSRFTLDLDRGIYHEDFNLEKRNRLLQERGDDVLQEKRLTREAWFVLKAKRAGLIPAVAPLVEQLLQGGIRLGDSVVAEALRLAEEI